jgi:site-specific recombinase XerD
VLELVQRRDRLGRFYTPMMDPEARRGKHPPNYGRTFPAEVYTPAEMHRMLAACGRGLVGHRTRAIMVCMWRGGLRIAEVLALEPRDVDVDEITLTVRHGKGNKRRVVPLDVEGMAVLERWMAIRTQLGVPRGRRLFVTITKGNVGAPVQPQHVRTKLHRVAERAVIDKRVHPHGFRHTAAYHCLLAGWNVKQIQLFLGHNDLATTSRYLDHLMPLELVQLGRARVWPGAEPALAGAQVAA